MNIVPSLNPIQMETLTQSLPTSEGAVSAIGSLANGLLQILVPVSSIMYSMLTETQLNQSINLPDPAVWILADGRDVTGSAYATLTGNTNAPDLRGIFVRGVNGTLSTVNPNGTLPLGTYTPDQLGLHTHTYQAQQDPISANFDPIFPTPRFETSIIFPQFFGAFNNTSIDGANETAPTNVTVNIFIRIN